ncbi:MAG TPA: hypothetical protein P5232_04160 [Candidatus Moranbacteria bacterium]|nr:hypothetical protein [Candidatus Moranbacteria bacterium]
MEKFYSDTKINEIANEVVKYLPSLNSFYKNEETLSEYSKRINFYKPSEIHLKRQFRFKQKIKEKIENLFNINERKEIKINIDDSWGVIGGIVDHHGILDHPWLLAVHLVSNFYKLLHKDKEGDILTFATGNVPLNEPFRRRGFVLNGKKINLFPKSDKDKIVYNLHTYEFDIVKRLKEESHQWQSFTNQEQFLLEKINNVIKNIDFSSCKTLGDQYTKINYYLWPYLFEEKLRENAARLISIEYDDIVIDYMIYVFENEKDSFVYKMLFENEFRELIIDEFEGINGAWDEEKKVGTHFFWGLDENNEHLRLELKGGFLIGENEFKLEFTPEAIIGKLKSKKILPGMLLKFSLIIFYMGMKPLAGYSLEYLTRMKIKMIEILAEYFPEEAELAKNIPLDNMNLISICQGRDSQGKLKELHAFDIFLKGGFSEEYFNKLDSIKFKEYMIPPLLFAYDYGISKYGNIKDKKNFSITEENLKKNLEKIF